MPRSLARLRYRQPSRPPKPFVPGSIARLVPENQLRGPVKVEVQDDHMQGLLSPKEWRVGKYSVRQVAEAQVNQGEVDGELNRRVRRAADYALHKSLPDPFKLQTVVNAKSLPQTTKKSTTPPWKPYTLRDVVDPEGQARHGEIIFVFRNTKSHQIIYSLAELLDNHHLEQLPFIGRHSKPPVLRPDEWVPHCVITFPTPEQGHNAHRKLREFRKLHELAWDKTHREWKNLNIKERIKKIMNQRANMSADLAEVLSIQEQHGAKMTGAVEKQQRDASEYMEKRWAEIHSLANAAVTKEKVADSVEWLEQQIRSLTRKLTLKHNQNEADQKRLKSAKIVQEIRLRKIKYAQRKEEQYKPIKNGLDIKAAPANEPGAEARLQDLEEQSRVLQAALEEPDPARSAEDQALDRRTLSDCKRDIRTLTEAFKAKEDAPNHYIYRSILPRHFKKTAPTPYTLEGVSILWADRRDARYAAGKWPEIIEHEKLPLSEARNGVDFLRHHDYEEQVAGEIGSILKAIQDNDKQPHEFVEGVPNIVEAESQLEMRPEF